MAFVLKKIEKFIWSIYPDLHKNSEIKVNKKL